jgi:tRNA (cytidine56-2'-O)-methyltransferase
MGVVKEVLPVFRPPVYILRLNHRRERDKRITTHCALVGRAFGAIRMYYSGDRDEKMEDSISRLSNKWGGNFTVEYIKNPLMFVKGWRENDGAAVHLTMYGLPISEYLQKLKDASLKSNLLLIIGASKVPIDYFKLVDFNIAIGHQPHSEVAALALFLDRIYEGKELELVFPEAKLRVLPQERSKRLMESS